MTEQQQQQQHNHNNNKNNNGDTHNTREEEEQAEDLKAVRDPYVHVTSTKGKEIRSILIDAFNCWLQVPNREINIIKGVIDKLHNASLLIDDIEDNSKLRRGHPCAHLIFGIPATINSANYMYFEALKDCQLLSNTNVIHTVYMDELLNLHRGQAMDIHWRDNSICPSEQQYLEMVKNKTGGLFRLSIGVMQAVSRENIDTDYTKLVNDLAVLFQILDDYLNLQSTTYHDNKSFCEDLTEGKFSFPIIHSINSDTSSRQLLNIVRQRSQDVDLKKYALKLMEKTKSFEYTVQALKNAEMEVRHEIERMGGNEALSQVVDYLMSKINDSSK